MQAWLSPSETSEVVEAISMTLNVAVADHKKAEFEGFMIMLTKCEECVDKANKFAGATKAKSIHIALLPTDSRSVKSYKISLDEKVLNTILVYKDKQVTAKFVNLTASKEDQAKLRAAIAKAAN
ncbi:MAG: hypothetical protein IIC73_04945 [Armatimonadetes bacterium]|nr:hypothetical protein [Armatimonadota bacterium]